MRSAFSRRVKEFKETVLFTGPGGIEKKLFCLNQLKKAALVADKNLISYHDTLLFICAFPPNKKILSFSERELKRITAFLKKEKRTAIFCNSGMPFTSYYSCFSHDLTRWLLSHPDCRIQLSEFKEGHLELNDVLKITLPSSEKSETTAGLMNEELLDVLRVPVKHRLRFLVNELSKLDEQPFVKDHLFESLGIYCDIISRNQKFAVAYNRFSLSETSFREEPVKSFDHFQLFNRPVNKPKKLSDGARNRLITVIKNSMALTDRETDTVTYMDESSLRYYQLEHGMAVAIYAMTAERQLPLESYVGYTLLVNGFPVAYGGAWVFGGIANFGINIFEAYRGSASGYIICQLLRLYRQVFGISYFEIEPYQFGLDNPDGIKSGAFWFYYRYGFRPRDNELYKISLKEKDKLKNDKNYRTPEKTLLRFTSSNMILQLGKRIPARVADITDRMIKLISQKYKSDSLKAEADCVEKFKAITGIETTTPEEVQVLKEVSLWAAASEITGKEKLNLLAEMVRVKPVNPYAYQGLLQNFFKNE